jgi:predicted ATPase
MNPPALRRIQLENFKAVQDSKSIRLTPLTVFIGNNGSGKSSLIEGLLTYQMIIQQGLDVAMNYWRGFDYIRNRAVSHEIRSKHDPKLLEPNPVKLKLSYKSYSLSIALTKSANQLIISEERIEFGKTAAIIRSADGLVVDPDHDRSIGKSPATEVIFKMSRVQEYLRELNQDGIDEQILNWQFLNLNPAIMGNPIPMRLSTNQVKLNPDASNLGHYLLDLYKLDIDAFNGLVETLQYVLPYAKDLQIQETSPLELEQRVYLQMTEGDFKIPGWLLSTGTLRVVAILALLRHPAPPPLIVIEELENGLDPRTINLLIEEIRSAIESGKTQVIITTHSPYLLDQLHLSQIIIVERSDTGEPIFSRPSDQPTLENWSKQFTPGQLYTMGQLNTL